MEVALEYTWRRILTLVLRLGHKFANHSLYHTNIPIQKTTKSPSGECHPKIGGEADGQKAQHGAEATEE